MVNIRTAPGAGSDIRDEDHSLAQLVQQGKLLPVISGEALEDLAFGRGAHAEIVSAYAAHISYPMGDRNELSKLVKYQGLYQEWKDRRLKEDYLDAIAGYLYQREKVRHGDAETEQMQEAAAEASGLTVSKFAGRLGYPSLEQGRDDPLLILAELKLPIYLTTSPYTFMETALQRAGRKPRTEFCRWHPGLDNVPSGLLSAGQREGDMRCDHNEPGAPYLPCSHKPLVYHLFGVDEYPDSLVLTEDDHLDFLMTVSQGRGKNRGVDPLHDIVKGALQSSALLLLGFSLPAWAFRSLYRGLIKPAPEAKLYERYCCLQLEPNEEQKRYLEDYLRKDAHFDEIYWQEVEAFCRRELRS
jgi:hypothetical protein